MRHHRIPATVADTVYALEEEEKEEEEEQIHALEG